MSKTDSAAPETSLEASTEDAPIESSIEDNDPEQPILVGLIKTILADVPIGQNLTYAELTAKAGTPDWQFALIDALALMQEKEAGRDAMFFLRCGAKIGLLRVSADEFATEGMSRRRKKIVTSANNGLRTARALAQSPDLSQEHKGYLGAHAATLAVVASVGKKYSGLGTGNAVLASPSKSPDWDGLKALYDPDDAKQDDN